MVRPVTVPLGRSAVAVGPVGLGCMGMSQSYGPADDEQSIATIRAAIDIGVDHLDTSDVYGAIGFGRPHDAARFGHNEELIGRALAGVRERVVVATKFATVVSEDGALARDGRPERVARACEASLRRLGTDHIDLYYYHRRDPAVPLAETVGAMGELVAAGKVRAIGLSEVSAADLREADAVCPVAALQSEYSLWERGVEASVLPACRELGITLVAYSPLGRAMLADRFRPGQVFAAGDMRAVLPRFDGAELGRNLGPVARLRAFAAARGVTPAQVSLAWLVAQGVVAIPGTKRAVYVRENLAALDVVLTLADTAELAAMFDEVWGARYPPALVEDPTAPATAADRGGHR